MIAYKCDRCGGYFGHKGTVLISERVEDSMTHSLSTNDYRLCPSCEKVLLSWMRGQNDLQKPSKRIQRKRSKTLRRLGEI